MVEKKAPKKVAKKTVKKDIKKQVKKEIKVKKSKITPARREFLRKQKKERNRKTSYKKAKPEKKEKLAKHARKTKWAPIWVILRKFGPGKKIHPSSITRHRRNWRRTKLKIGPRKLKKSHYG